jgi:putative alpha-1,2-mannosidase
MTAENLSDVNIYIQSMTINGKDWNSPFITHDQIAKGSSIIFKMGPNPNLNWGIVSTVPE